MPVENVKITARGANRKRRDQGQARTLQELIHLGQARGMKNPVAWAKHVHYARQGKHG